MLVAAVVVVAALFTPGQAPAQQECKSAFGKTACGYHCVAAFGDVRCAQTPLGACEAAFGKVFCADPPRSVERLPDATPMRCQSAFGKTACGYQCVAAFGDVQCAQTPYGRCESAFGKITCADPAQLGRGGHGGGRHHQGQQGGQPNQQMECKNAFGKSACGFHCLAAFGDVQCAQTPLGNCTSAFGTITCADPPRHMDGGTNQQMECKSAFGKTACGYQCKAAFGDVQCATTPNGVCTAAYGKVVCSQ